jgi:hypothetical protein
LFVYSAGHYSIQNNDSVAIAGFFIYQVMGHLYPLLGHGRFCPNLWCDGLELHDESGAPLLLLTTLGDCGKVKQIMNGVLRLTG